MDGILPQTDAIGKHRHITRITAHLKKKLAVLVQSLVLQQIIADQTARWSAQIRFLGIVRSDLGRLIC